jgi:flagellar biogenesis protein FliO
MLPGAVQTAATAAALGVVVLMIVVAGRAARLLPALRRADGNAAIRLRGTLALDARRRLHLVEVDGRHALVLTGGGQDVLLAWGDGGAAGRGTP